MQQKINEFITAATGARQLQRESVIQSLWSGYGEIARYRLQAAVVNHQPITSAVLKYIAPPTEQDHPRGWNSDRSHQRKLQSYKIEMHWYQHWAPLCDLHCRVPDCYGVDQVSYQGQELGLILLEDLDAAGFAARHQYLDEQKIRQCLAWLAHFHGRFLGKSPEGLWSVGSYWHLATRPDELAVMDNKSLQAAAAEIDRRLNSATYQTFIHGDAKVANFCFADKGHDVAAVDFQYVGAGCGIKDVAYFLGSCLDENECERQQDTCLDYYFSVLAEVVAELHPSVDVVALEQEWRQLYPFAWTDFYRFLQGWMPNHKKINRYTLQLAEQTLAMIAD
ncbi:MAG: hypothetical protein ACJAYG_001998 [Oceanicoccus sp.]|jgi:hypothetical protein